MKKYPSVLQQDSKDCGVACLLSVIEYYKGYIKLEHLRELSNTNREGVNAYNLIKCAEKIGFTSEGIKCNITDIQKNRIILPVIAHVIIDKKYAHYIVIYEVGKKHLIIHDPSKGLKKISIKEFLNIWNGIVITLIPNRILPIEKNAFNIYNFSLKLFWQNKKPFKELIILSFMTTIFSVITAYYFETLINSVNELKSLTYLTFIFIIYLVITFFKIITDYLRNHILILLNNKIDILLTQDIFKKIILLPYQYYHNHTTGDIISRFNDLGILKDTLSKIFVTFFIDTSLMLISLTFLFIINYKLTYISLLILLLYIIIFFIFNKFFRKYIYLLKYKKANLSTRLVESISGFQTIKGLFLENKVYKQFKLEHLDLFNNNYKFEKTYNMELCFKEATSEFGTLLLLFMGIILVSKQELTITSLITYNMLFSYFIVPIRNIIDTNISIKESKSALERINDILENNLDKCILELTNGDIQFKNTSFAYNNKNVLQNINLLIKNGENIVITGSSGSGKSTIFKLLLKYYDVKRNMITIDNKDINDISYESIRKYITYISQNETLFTDTISNNILLDRNVREEDFLKAVRITCVDEVINKSYLGYNMLIEENGFNLSGGEKQRIFLARCLLSNSKYIIIDEAMSAMDVSMERKILKDIMKNYNKNIIMITHRLDNIDLFDRQIVIERGKVVNDVRKCISYSK